MDVYLAILRNATDEDSGLLLRGSMLSCAFSPCHGSFLRTSFPNLQQNESRNAASSEYFLDKSYKSKGPNFSVFRFRPS